MGAGPSSPAPAWVGHRLPRCLLDIYATSTATTLAIALGYATVLRAVGPDAIERVLSYVQMIMSFAVYGGQFLISGVLSRTRPEPGRCRRRRGSCSTRAPGSAATSRSPTARYRVVCSSRALGVSVAVLALMASQAGRTSVAASTRKRLGAMTVAARAKAARAAERRGRRRVVVLDRRSASGRAARAQPVPPRSPVPHGRAGPAAVHAAVHADGRPQRRGRRSVQRHAQPCRHGR